MEMNPGDAPLDRKSLEIRARLAAQEDRKHLNEQARRAGMPSGVFQRQQIAQVLDERLRHLNEVLDRLVRTLGPDPSSSVKPAQMDRPPGT